MQPLLPKDTYRHAVRYTNLAGPLTHLNPTHAPTQWATAAMKGDTYTRMGCFKQAVGMHALQGACNLKLQLPVHFGVAYATASVGGVAAWMALMALQNVGTGSELSEEILTVLHANYPNVPLQNFNDRAKFGRLGTPERIARDRAQTAFDAGRGLAHAAWTGVALGLNGLLWLPRVGAALLSHGITMTCALVGACVGVARFCYDAVTQGHVRAPHHYIYGMPPQPDVIHAALAELDKLDIDRGWLKNVFEQPSADQLALAAYYLAELREDGSSTSFDTEIARLANSVASERSFDPEARAMLRKLTEAFFGDACAPGTLAKTYRRRTLTVHPDKGPERATREELTRALTTLKTSIEGLPTLKKAFFTNPA